MCSFLIQKSESSSVKFTVSKLASLAYLTRPPAAAVPDFAAAHPLCFHVALYSLDARADCARFLAAGATHVLDEPQPDGSLLIMLRDPWGIPLQLCQRAQPFPGF